MKVIFNAEQEEAIQRLTALRIIVGCEVENQDSRKYAFESIDILAKLMGDTRQLEMLLNTYYKYVDE